MKELGIIHKTIVCGSVYLTAQFGQEIMRFYPTKKVFVTTEQDFEKSRRRLFVSRILTSDYDGIVSGILNLRKFESPKNVNKPLFQKKLMSLMRSLVTQKLMTTKSHSSKHNRCVEVLRQT